MWLVTWYSCTYITIPNFTSSPLKQLFQMLNRNCFLYEIWAPTWVSEPVGNTELWQWAYMIVIWRYCISTAGYVLSLLNYATIYWILKCVVFILPRPNLANLMKDKYNLCNRPVTWICSQILWVFPGLGLGVPSGFMKIRLLVLHYPADK